MAALHPLCQCLSAWDRRDGRRCEHDSWGVRRPTQHETWATPSRELPFPLFLLLAVICGVLFAGLLLLGQSAVCGMHNGQHQICEGYQPATTEETR